MEGQGVAASAASGAGEHAESGQGAVAAELDHLALDHPAENHVTSDIADGGEGLGRNRDDSHVMVTPGHPEASGQDASMPQLPESSQPPQPSREERSYRESQPELPSRQIKSDKLDNIVDPDRNNDAVARDENTGHNQTAAGLVPTVADAPAVNAPAADAFPTAPPPETAATVGPVSASAVPPDSGEPETVQFAAVPPEGPEPVWDSAPEPIQPQPAQPESVQPESVQPELELERPGTAEPVTVQFPAVPPEATEPVSGSEAAPSQSEPVPEPSPSRVPSPSPQPSPSRVPSPPRPNPSPPRQPSPSP